MLDRASIRGASPPNAAGTAVDLLLSRNSNLMSPRHMQMPPGTELTAMARRNLLGSAGIVRSVRIAGSVGRTMSLTRMARAPRRRQSSAVRPGTADPLV